MAAVGIALDTNHLLSAAPADKTIKDAQDADLLMGHHLRLLRPVHARVCGRYFPSSLFPYLSIYIYIYITDVEIYTLTQVNCVLYSATLVLVLISSAVIISVSVLSLWVIGL